MNPVSQGTSLLYELLKFIMILKISPQKFSHTLYMYVDCTLCIFILVEESVGVQSCSSVIMRH